MGNKYNFTPLYNWCIDNNKENILEEWDCDLNGYKNPRNVSYGSNSKVWWKCTKGHPSYETPPSKRIIGHGCPICSNHKIVEDINSFKKLQPNLMKEWLWEENNKLGIYPDKISEKSGKNVWWKCSKCGNIWKSIVNNRTDKNSGCPYCANLKLKEGFNDLLTKNPKLADEWDYEKNKNLTPNKVVEYSTKKVWWKCKKCGGEWMATPNQRHKHNCPYCGHHKLRTPKDSIEFLFPELLEEWDYEKNLDILPSNCSKSSDKYIWWKCKNGHSWRTQVKTRTKGSGCPYCSNKKVLVGYNDLFSKFPELEKEWDYERNVNLDPKKISFGSEMKAHWKCFKCGNKWETLVSLRTLGSGCPKCGIEKSTINRLRNKASKNPLFSSYPELKKEWDYERNRIDIDILSSSSNKVVWWKCKNGHSWRASIAQRTSKKTGCPYCAGQRVICGINDLKTLNDELAAEWDYQLNKSLKPENVCLHSSKIVWWRCEKCGNSWKAKINNRANGRGCPNCSPSGTSFIEQSIYYYIKKIYFDAENRYKYDDYELDIYIPSIKTAIEYDGSYYHSIKNSEQRELNKDLFCKKENIKLIRLREKPLETTKNAINIQCDCSNWSSLEELIKNLLTYLGNENEIEVSIKKDLTKIIGIKKKLIDKKSFGSSYPSVLKEWDYEKNYPLLPNYFSKGSSTKVWWKCSKGHNWEAKISNRCKNKGTNCPYCNPKTHDREVLCIETNEIFKNAIIAAQQYNCSVSTIRSACLGKCETAKGYHWRYTIKTLS